MPKDGDGSSRGDAEVELSRRDRILTAVALASGYLIEAQEIDRSIERALAEIALAAGADRAFISPLESSEAAPEKSHAVSGYAWCHPEIPNFEQATSSIPSLGALPDSLNELNAAGSLFICQTGARSDVKLILDGMEAQSFLAFPLQIQALPCIAGFVACREERLWSDGERALLRVAMNMIGSMLSRHRMETTLRHRTEDLITANEQLAKAARLKDEFLASMSHELRTPLNAILGLSEALLEKVFGPLNDNQCRYLGRIEESGRHLLALINDILDLSKIEAGKLTPNLQDVDVESTCQASLRMVREQALKKSINFSTQIESEVTVVKTDERLLKQMLVNLLTNAVKFTAEGGKIGLEVSSDASDTWLQFSVWDTGIGIAKENMGLLFQPFVQLDSSLSRQFAGTGLGLSLVKRMVSILGGEVLVESELNQGSRFTLLIPWVKEQQPKSPTASTSPTPAERAQPSIPSTQTTARASAVKPLILLAEDNPVNITMMKGYLEHKGFRVVIAMNGEEAIHAVQVNPPDLILMDIQMPSMDGLEATRQIKANPAYRHIPIIVLTALAMPGDRRRCMAAGADDYFTKPSRLADLQAVIDAQLQHSQKKP